MNAETTPQENIAATLAKVLPKPTQLHTQTAVGEDIAIAHFAMPPGYTLKSVDHEALLPGPRKVNLTATFATAQSFLAYVNAHATTRTPTVWTAFSPLNNLLQFIAVIDEHTPGSNRWRGHKAVYKPAMSIEWATWIRNNGAEKIKGQVEFAEFLEANERDILAGPTFPSSTDMLKMATEFEAHAEKRLKSVIKLQGGGVAIDYVNSDNAETIERMKVFSRFQLGLPVFWTMPMTADAPVKGYPLVARLKYRQVSGQVRFYYELIRPDLVYQTAALELIDEVRNGLAEASIPLLMGAAE